MEKIYIGEINGYNYWLGDIVFKGLDWYQAKDVCEALGDGWELPSKEVMELAWENPYTRNILKSEEGWYWTSSEVSSSLAWYQNSLTWIQCALGNKTSGTYKLVCPVYKERAEDKPTSTDHKVFYTRKTNPDGSVCNLSGITYVFSKNEGGTYNLHASVCRGDNFSKAVGREVAINSAPLIKNIEFNDGEFIDLLNDFEMYVGLYYDGVYEVIEKRVIKAKKSPILLEERRIKKEMEECRKGWAKAIEDYRTYIGTLGYPKEIEVYTLRISKKELGLLLGLVGKVTYRDMKGGDALYKKLKALDELFTSKVYKGTAHLPTIFTGGLEDAVDNILKG